MKLLKKYILTLFTCIISVYIIKGQERVPFTIRYAFPDGESKNGDFVMTGNTNLTLEAYSDTQNNGQQNLVYVDIDADPDTFNSSSALLQLKLENEALPACTEIVWAGLYWSARTHAGGTTVSSPMVFDVTKNGVTKTFDKREIKLKGPGDLAYTIFTADDSNIFYPILHNPVSRNGVMYSAFVDVTSFVKSKGEGMYMAADIPAREITALENDGTGLYGGWGLVVAYKNKKMKARDVKIYDGHYYIFPNDGNEVRFELNVPGLNTIPQGPVNLKLGLMAGEGDIAINNSNDYFEIKRFDNGVFQRLSHLPNVTEDNFFSSKIDVFTPENTASRVPYIVNNTGMDILMFDIENSGNAVIGNSQTDVTFRYGTSADTYIIYMIGMSVDAFFPESEAILSVASIDGVPPVGTAPYTVTPGQIIEYKLQFINNGNENLVNSYVKIPIPFGTTYVPNSLATNTYFSGSDALSPNFLPSDGTNGSVDWQINTLPMRSAAWNFDPNYVLADLSYKIKVTEDCRILKSSLCDVFVESKGILRGLGENSGMNLLEYGSDTVGRQTAIGITVNECGSVIERGSILTNVDSDAYVATNCTSTPEVFTYESCQDNMISFSTIQNDFPIGTKFYNSFPISASSQLITATQNFPTTVGEIDYYAVQAGNDNCAIPLKIIYNEVPNATISGMEECLDTSIPFITFEATGGQAPYTFNYNLNGIPQVISTSGSNASVMVNAPNNIPTTYNYQLTKVTDNKGCDRDLNLTAEVKINAPPIVQNTTVAICDDNFDGTYTYTLSDANALVVADDVSLYHFSYFTSLAYAQNNTNAIASISNYNLGPVPTQIYIVVENKETLCKSIAVVFFIQNTLQTVNSINLDAECSDGVLSESGFATFDLTAQNDEVNSNGIQFTYYLTENDAKNGGTSGQISDPTTFRNTVANNQTIWVRIQETDKCDAIASLGLIVNELPYSTTLEDQLICYNDIITLDPGSAFISYQWYFNDELLAGETHQTLSHVNQPGEYAVMLESANHCKYKQVVRVQRGNIPYIVDIKYGNSTVEFIGSGGVPPYEYSINGGAFSLNTFYNLEPGLYNVSIRSQTCESEPIPVPVVGWATVFTPNGDNKNDIWRIKGIEFTSEPKVWIYDRYGKNLGELSSKTNFIWDGKYLGRSLPTTSYWFTMQFINAFLGKSYIFNGYIMVKDRNDGSNMEFYNNE